MKVRFTNPNGTKFGKEEHVENGVGNTLLALGEVVIIPPAKRGTNEWLTERAEEEARRVATIPQSQREVFYATATWQLSTSAIAQDPTIIKLLGRERTVYAKAAQRSDKDFRTSMRDAGCPDNVISAYLESVNAKVDPAILQERQIQERNRQNAATQLRQRDAGATAVILGAALKVGQ
jgi:hypothetical protein